MIDPFKLATMGYGPGSSIFEFHMLGVGFQVQVTPILGGGPGSALPESQLYKVVIQVKFKGKQWREERILDKRQLNNLEKVIASFKSIVSIIDKVKFSIGNVRNRIVETSVHIWRKMK